MLMILLQNIRNVHLNGPPLTLLWLLINFISRCREEIEIERIDDIPSQPYISNDERKALNDLRKRNDIIIKWADMGGAVGWRRDLYI